MTISEGLNEDFRDVLVELGLIGREQLEAAIDAQRLETAKALRLTKD